MDLHLLIRGTSQWKLVRRIENYISTKHRSGYEIWSVTLQQSQHPISPDSSVVQTKIIIYTLLKQNFICLK